MASELVWIGSVYPRQSIPRAACTQPRQQRHDCFQKIIMAKVGQKKIKERPTRPVTFVSRASVARGARP